MQDTFYEDGKEFMPQRPINKKVKNKILSYLPSAVLTIALIAFSAFGSILQFNFELKEIILTVFLINTALRLICTVLSKYIGSNLRYNRDLDSQEVTTIREEFVEDGKNINKDKFERFIAKQNLKAKKEAYLIKQNEKIMQLTKKINSLKYKNELSYSKRREKRIEKIKTKVKDLKDISTKEYIDLNITYIRVKSNKLKSAWFLVPSEDEVKGEKKYTLNEATENIKEIIFTLPFTLLIICFGSLIASNVLFGTINVASMIYDIMIILFNYVFGWYVIGKKNIAKLLTVYRNRQGVLARFNNEEKIEKQEVSI